MNIEIAEKIVSNTTDTTGTSDITDSNTTSGDDPQNSDFNPEDILNDPMFKPLVNISLKIFIK